MCFVLKIDFVCHYFAPNHIYAVGRCLGGWPDIVFDEDRKIMFCPIQKVFSLHFVFVLFFSREMGSYLHLCTFKRLVLVSGENFSYVSLVQRIGLRMSSSGTFPLFMSNCCCGASNQLICSFRSIICCPPKGLLLQVKDSTRIEIKQRQYIDKTKKRRRRRRRLPELIYRYISDVTIDTRWKKWSRN
jgi:hypothetical protein